MVWNNKTRKKEQEPRRADQKRRSKNGRQVRSRDSGEQRCTEGRGSVPLRCANACRRMGSMISNLGVARDGVLDAPGDVPPKEVAESRRGDGSGRTCRCLWSPSHAGRACRQHGVMSACAALRPGPVGRPDLPRCPSAHVYSLVLRRLWTASVLAAIDAPGARGDQAPIRSA
jgi:hypothetical protein